MPARVDDFNKKFVYTKTNPENIISANKNALFYRDGHSFYVNHSGELDGAWEKLPYKTVIIPPPPATKLLMFETERELWLKSTDGYIDEYKQVLPKTGWKFLTYKNVFSGASPKKLNWVFPVPTSSTDPIGNDNSRSYDENYFYAKISGVWLRTPISIYTYPGTEQDIDRPEFTTQLPFVDPPRQVPVPPNSNSYVSSTPGDQSYDKDYFYIKISRWKRSRINIYYDTVKMARF